MNTADKEKIMVVVNSKIVNATAQDRLTYELFNSTAVHVEEEIQRKYPAVMQHWRLTYFAWDVSQYLRQCHVDPTDIKALIGEALQLLATTLAPGKRIEELPAVLRKREPKRPTFDV
jgi:hypothetical protein